jgi:ATP:ADP antiporter, AAA family
MTSRQRPDTAVVTAMFCSGLVTAQFIGGKAARDALFLANLPVTTLPTMIIVASVFSIAVVAAFSRVTARVSPAKVVPAVFATSAALLLLEWIITYSAPKPAAVLVYLHVSGIVPVLGSGFWLIATEHFDPRTAKKRFGQIASAGTAGGILGGLFAERAGSLFGVTAVLPILAVLSVMGAWGVRRLAKGEESLRPAPSNERLRNAAQDAPLSGFRALIEIPYIRHLAALVLLGTMSAALVDYVFKVQAVSTFGKGETLLRFFAVYYAATSVITFVVQTWSSQFLLQRFGLAFATSLPSIALLAGSFVGLLVPGFKSVLGARGGETVFRGSLFRFGYELFYTPIPPNQKRAVKSIIDIGFDRLGDVAGAGIIRLVLMYAPNAHYPAILLFLGVASSAVAVVVASRLNRGYIQTLEKSLLNQALELDLSDVEDLTTRTTLLRTLRNRDSTLRIPRLADAEPGWRSEVPTPDVGDPELQELADLRSRDRERIVKVLRRDEGVTAGLVPYVIPLLAWNPVAADAAFALRKVAEERVGQLIDALIDPNQDFAVRRRLARVFSICVSQRAGDGLMLGLDDLRFEVRFQCGRSLSAILETNPSVKIDKDRVLEVILREVAVGRPVWESRRLLDELDPREGVAFVDEFVRDRAGQSLAHVFTLLSLVLPREPLQIAFRGLQTGDQNLRGTALEYLEGVLPAGVRERLWPFLEDRRPPRRSPRPHDQILAELLRSNQSIMVNLEELQRREQEKPDAEALNKP